MVRIREIVQQQTIPTCPPFIITGVHGGIMRTCGKYRDRCSGSQKDQDMVFVLYLHIYLYR